MIYITQGHESGIGLEIFLKSFLLLTSNQKKQIALVVNHKQFLQNITDLNLSIDLFTELKLIFNRDTTAFASTDSLLTALELISPQDLLITLPTSKDQLVLHGKKLTGYTEFFREFFHQPNLPMTFKGLDQNIMLLSDHIPLNSVTQYITKERIIEKTSITLDSFQKYFFSFDQVIFAGINPHAGENGVLGNEDVVISQAIMELEHKYGKIFLGPFSGDVLHAYKDTTKRQLFISMYHDQGLAPFKSHFGLIGLNITLGLPFLRLSVDHGTAFELYAKNKANIMGMLYLLKQAFEVINVHQRN